MNSNRKILSIVFLLLVIAVVLGAVLLSVPAASAQDIGYQAWPGKMEGFPITSNELFIVRKGDGFYLQLYAGGFPYPIDCRIMPGMVPSCSGPALCGINGPYGPEGVLYDPGTYLWYSGWTESGAPSGLNFNGNLFEGSITTPGTYEVRVTLLVRDYHLGNCDLYTALNPIFGGWADPLENVFTSAPYPFATGWRLCSSQDIPKRRRQGLASNTLSLSRKKRMA